MVERFRMPVVKKPKSRIGATNRCLSHEPSISRQKQAQIRIQHEMARLLIYNSTELGPTTQNLLLQAIEWALDISIVKARAMMRFSSMNVNRCGRLKTIEVGKREMALKLQFSSLHSFPF